MQAPPKHSTLTSFPNQFMVWHCKNSNVNEREIEKRTNEPHGQIAAIHKSRERNEKKNEIPNNSPHKSR